MSGLMQHIQIGWGGFFGTLAILIALLFARRLLPPDRRRRGRVALAFLALSLVARLLVGGLLEMGAKPAADVVSFIAVLLESFGITGVVALLAFDVALARVRIDVPSLVRDILVGIALAIITIGVLQSVGVNVTGLITTSAVLTAVVGLALQSTMSNLFAGLSLQVDRSLAVGDWVLVNGRVGRIAAIKWRSTLLVTRDGDGVIVPNAHLLNQEVVNYSKPTTQHRVTLKVGIHYRHAPNDVKRALLDAAAGVPGVLDAPAPDCFPSELGDSAVVYALRYWVDDVQREAVIDGEVRTRVWYATQRAGLEIPFPTRSLFMHSVDEKRVEREREQEVGERAAVLAQTDLFAALDDADRKTLARTLRTVSFADGERIIRQGEPGDSLYLVRAGQVAVRLAVDGVEREVATIGPGQFFGEMSLMTGEPRRATCAAKGDATCYVMQYGSFRRVLENRPKIAEQISAVLGARQTALDGEREDLSAEARAKKTAENSSRLLARIRDFFNLG